MMKAMAHHETLRLADSKDDIITQCTEPSPDRHNDPDFMSNDSKTKQLTLHFTQQVLFSSER